MISLGIVGAGHIGGMVAHRALWQGWGEVILYDLREGLAQGKVKDLYQAAVIGGCSAPYIHAASSCQELASCDIIVVTAGKARQPGMDRKDILAANKEIISSVAKALKGTEAIIIVVTNPVDTMSLWMYHLLQIPRQRVIGMAGILDSGRFRALLAQTLTLAPETIQAWVIGPHNDDMMPLFSSIHLEGLPVPPGHLSPEQIAEVTEKTRYGGSEIVNLLGEGSAFYGPAEAISVMIQAIIYDQKRLLPCSVRLEGEYGLRDIFCGVPVVLGKAGAESIVEITLSSQERAAFQEKARSLYAAKEVCGIKET